MAVSWLIWRKQRNARHSRRSADIRPRVVYGALIFGGRLLHWLDETATNPR
jgi:hypothetical protein